MSNYVLLNTKVARNSKRFKLISIVIIFTTLTTFYYGYKFYEPTDKAEKISGKFSMAEITSKIYKNQEGKIKKPQKKKNILFWTRFMGDTYWTTGDTEEAGEEILKSVQCPVTNCFFTHNHNLLGGETKFDAIIYHYPELRKFQWPKKRSQNQLYIMTSLE
jgi:hypothetical protein